jgi:hypothetical protein
MVTKAITTIDSLVFAFPGPRNRGAAEGTPEH